MLLADQYAAEWASFLRTVSDTDLLVTARDFIWLAEFGPVEGRDTFSLKRDGVVNELRARGMDGQLEALRREMGEERVNWERTSVALGPWRYPARDRMRHRRRTTGASVISHVASSGTGWGGFYRDCMYQH
jgi:hypothetical protein